MSAKAFNWLEVWVLLNHLLERGQSQIELVGMVLGEQSNSESAVECSFSVVDVQFAAERIYER